MRSDTKNNKLDTVVAIAAIILIVCAWFIGNILENNRSAYNISELFPPSHKVENIADKLYLIQSGDSTLYGAIGRTVGYGGEIEVFTVVNQKTEIIEIYLLDHHETPSFITKVLKNDYLSQFLEQTISHDIPILDGISGATLTSNALRKAVFAGSKEMGQTVFKIKYPPEDDPNIIFGLPEISVILLLLLALIVNLKLIRKPKSLWWVSILISIVVIGFIKGGLITIAKIDSYMIGHITNWQANLYWIILFAGVIISTLSFGKNFYCAWICPFGAIQECTAFIGKARSKERLEVFKWIQRFLALSAIILGILFRNPSIAGYEVFPAMFAFVGSEILFVLLAISLIVSLFVKRFWCNYLCPVGPALNFLAHVRNLLFVRNKIQKELK